MAGSSKVPRATDIIMNYLKLSNEITRVACRNGASNFIPPNPLHQSYHCTQNDSSSKPPNSLAANASDMLVGPGSVR